MRQNNYIKNYLKYSREKQGYKRGARLQNFLNKYNKIDFSIFTPLQKEAIKRFYFECETLASIASDWNCSHQNVSLVKGRAIKKLNKYHGY